MKQIIKPLIWSGSLYQDKYPALCSDRYLIVSEAIKLCRKLNTKYISHGCTGMGNDQVRFDLSIQAFGNYKTITPIREIQNKVTDVRGYEQEYLKKKGIKFRAFIQSTVLMKILWALLFLDQKLMIGRSHP